MINPELKMKATFLFAVMPWLTDILDELDEYPTIYHGKFKISAEKFKDELDDKIDRIYVGATKKEREQANSLYLDVSNALDKQFETYKQQLK